MNEKITAYVLNEMPPDERAAFEAELNQDASLRAQVEEMQSFCTLLHDNVSTGSDAASTTDQETTFTSDQREVVISAFKDNQPVQTDRKPDNVVRPPFWRHPFLMSGAAIAACLTVLLLVNLDRVERPEMTVVAEMQVTAPSAQKPEVADDAAVPSTDTIAARNADLMQLEQNGKDLRRIQDEVRKQVAEPKKDTSTVVAAAPAEAPGVSAMPMPAPPPSAPMASRGGAEPKTLDVAAAPAVVASPEESLRTLNKVRAEAYARDSLTARHDQRARMSHEVTRRWESNTSHENESYTQITENTFKTSSVEPLSTFSIDVDTASYANVRRYLNDGLRPPTDAVRIEELINYFPYSYEPPTDGKPFSVTVDMAEAPWQPLHRLARVAIKGREIHGERGPANFVFLVDVSGSMNSRDKLPLVIQSLRMLVDQIRADDRVSLVTYAGESRVVLESTPGAQKEKILNGINGLEADGSTHGSSGIRMAYEQAVANFQKDGVNRVILCTDGDFNVGISSPEELEKLITEKAKSKVFLSVLGYGTGNLKDRTMETLADKGNGNYAYIDSVSEARKVLVEQMTGTLITIAKDVKIQVEFNPAQVAAYRLIGYENRTLAKEDFNNDQKDAGEIGAGHTVTALYEIVPAGLKYPNGRPVVDELKYAQTAPQPAAEPSAAVADAAPAVASPESMTVKLRYKAPEGDVSSLIEIPVTDSGKKLKEADQDFQFASSVAGFGMLLRKSPNANNLTWDQVRELAQKGKGADLQGYRGEFLQLIEKARGLD